MNDTALVADDLSGRLVYVSASRNRRPVSADVGCPFCLGGQESPGGQAPYGFPNRWPPMEPGRCDLIVYGPDHGRDLGHLPPAHVAAVVDLWATRGAAQWRRPGTECVLVFENRGPEAGATVAHPHSQLFGFPFQPPLCRVQREQGCPACLAPDPELIVDVIGGWVASVPEASPTPYSVRLNAPRHVDRLDRLSAPERHELAHAVSRTVRRLDRLFLRPMPYQMWIAQVPGGHLNMMFSGLLRGPDQLRIPGAAEAATGLAFSPLSPHHACAALRAATSELDRAEMLCRHECRVPSAVT